MPLLEALFDEIIVPPAVAREVSPSVVLPAWIVEQALQQPLHPSVLQPTLGPGESEAISLAFEVTAHLVILDDQAARGVAQSLGLPVMGTLGVLLAAKRQALITAIRPHLDALQRHSFHMDTPLYDLVLARRRKSVILS